MNEKEIELQKLLTQAFIAADDIRDTLYSMKALAYMVGCVILQIADGCTPADHELLRSVSDLGSDTMDGILHEISQKLEIIDNLTDILGKRLDPRAEEIAA